MSDNTYTCEICEAEDDLIALTYMAEGTVEILCAVDFAYRLKEAGDRWGDPEKWKIFIPVRLASDYVLLSQRHVVYFVVIG